MLEKSGPGSNTPLHEAVKFTRLGQKGWEDLVETILDKEPTTILELNKQGHSPYRYHLNTGGALLGQRDVGAINGTQVNTKHADAVNIKNSSG